jgi:hypothetical protein
MRGRGSVILLVILANLLIGLLAAAAIARHQHLRRQADRPDRPGPAVVTAPGAPVAAGVPGAAAPPPVVPEPAPVPESRRRNNNSRYNRYDRPGQNVRAIGETTFGRR